MWKTFWATQQRFFKLLCVSMKVSGLLRLQVTRSRHCARLSRTAFSGRTDGRAAQCGSQPSGEGCAWPQIPLVVKEAKAALAAGQCVVIGLQATGEAAAQVSITVAASRSAAYVFLSHRL